MAVERWMIVPPYIWEIVAMPTFNRPQVQMEPKLVIVYAISICLCLSAMLIYIYPSIRATNLMYEYSGHVKKLAEAKERNKKMKLEISALSSYDFIETRAVKDLGFVAPSSGQVVLIEKK